MFRTSHTLFIFLLTLLTLLLSIFILEVPINASDLISGRAVYKMNCAICHGEFGKGNGPKANELDLKPIDFTNPEMAEDITSEDFERAIVQGLPDIIEHTFGHLLSNEEVNNVIYYLQSLLR